MRPWRRCAGARRACHAGAGPAPRGTPPPEGRNSMTDTDRNGALPLARRTALGGAAAALAATLAGASGAAAQGSRYDRGAAPVRYPDADIVAIDPKRFTARL